MGHKKKKYSGKPVQTPSPPEKKFSGSKLTGIIIIAAVVAIILLVFGVGYYQNYVAPFRQMIIQVDDSKVYMDYFLRRTKLGGGDPLSMITSMTQELVIREAATDYVPDVTADEIKQELMTRANGSDNVTISEAEFREWYRQQLNETKLSDREYKDLVRTGLLADKLEAYLKEQVPAAAEQVHVNLIEVEKYEDAQKVVERLKAGESFAAIAKELSLDASAENGGDLGWLPRGVKDSAFDKEVFGLEVNAISEPYAVENGYYVLKVTGKEASRELSSENVQSLKDNALKNWLQEEPAKHTINYKFDSEIYAWINWQLAKSGSGSQESGS